MALGNQKSSFEKAYESLLVAAHIFFIILIWLGIGIWLRKQIREYPKFMGLLAILWLSVALNFQPENHPIFNFLYYTGIALAVCILPVTIIGTSIVFFIVGLGFIITNANMAFLPWIIGATAIFLCLVDYGTINEEFATDEIRLASIIVAAAFIFPVSVEYYGRPSLAEYNNWLIGKSETAGWLGYIRFLKEKEKLIALEDARTAGQNAQIYKPSKECQTNGALIRKDGEIDLKEFLFGKGSKNNSSSLKADNPYFYSTESGYRLVVNLLTTDTYVTVYSNDTTKEKFFVDACNVVRCTNPDCTKNYIITKRFSNRSSEIRIFHPSFAKEISNSYPIEGVLSQWIPEFESEIGPLSDCFILSSKKSESIFCKDVGLIEHRPLSSEEGFTRIPRRDLINGEYQYGWASTTDTIKFKNPNNPINKYSSHIEECRTDVTERKCFDLLNLLNRECPGCVLNVKRFLCDKKSDLACGMLLFELNEGNKKTGTIGGKHNAEAIEKIKLDLETSCASNSSTACDYLAVYYEKEFRSDTKNTEQFDNAMRVSEIGCATRGNNSCLVLGGLRLENKNHLGVLDLKKSCDLANEAACDLLKKVKIQWEEFICSSSLGATFQKTQNGQTKVKEISSNSILKKIGVQEGYILESLGSLKSGDINPTVLRSIKRGSPIKATFSYGNKIINNDVTFENECPKGFESPEVLIRGIASDSKAIKGR